MPKQKTSSTAKKRFVLKKSGLIKRGKQNRRHNTGKKRAATKMAAKRSVYVSKAETKTIRELIS